MEIKLNARLSAFTNVNLKTLAPQNFTFFGTLTTNWDGEVAPFTQRVEVEGLLAKDDEQAIVDVVLSSDWNLAVAEDEQWANVKKVVIENGAFVAYSETAIDIPLRVIIKVVR